MTQPTNTITMATGDPGELSMLTIPEACASLRIGRSALYDLIRSGQLKTMKIGRRRLIHPADFDQLLDTLRSAEDNI